ncbi:MAG: hypothetical protein CMD16_04415 [Flavobacteriales bacterium]|nr:hypothetical protein [Flavobacteriales bacterium]|tara:strand:+ start:382 stop:1710 length:1329 start_codon:yes stop_codon:yes gene_type:complete
MKEIIIYTPTITSRHIYVFKLIFEEICHVGYELVDKIDLFQSSEKIKINYSRNRMSNDEIFVEADGLLSSRDIIEVDLNFFKENNKEYLFRTTQDSSYLHDIFSSVFYLVSRYEEYLPHLKDQFGRYLASESIAFKKGFLRKPVVNIWIQEFVCFIKDFASTLEVKTASFSYISTIDIDNAYLYKGKGFVRTIALIVRSLLNLDFKNIRFMFSIFFERRKDPFDTYSFQFNLQKKYNIDVRYFILLGDYGLNDKNLSYSNSNVISLIKRLSDLALVGIHPSFRSNDGINILQKEIARLEDIQKRAVFFSRQHFLQLSLPETYKRLISLGITEDFTMGYASELGFRAGIASPFSFYDLDMEQPLSIKVYPFSITDDILKFNLQLNVEDVQNEIAEIIEAVKRINGTLISVWHNDTFSNFGVWKDWKNVYEDMIKQIIYKDENN